MPASASLANTLFLLLSQHRNQLCVWLQQRPEKQRDGLLLQLMLDDLGTLENCFLQVHWCYIIKSALNFLVFMRSPVSSKSAMS